MEVRPAATIMLVRDAASAGAGGVPEASSLEVLMLRRHTESAFAAGAWVFPGGRVDEADGGAVSVRGGPSDAEASAILGVASGGLAFWIAAARECFEEAGVLLARHADSGLALDGSNDLVAARLARLRRDLHAGRSSFAQVLAAENLVLDLGEVHYVSHWITPPGQPRRFDTRFFVAPAPPSQLVSHDTSETVDSVWTSPAVALERHRASEIFMVFPTIKQLETLSRFASTAELLAAARAIGPVPTSAPRHRGDRELPGAALDGVLLTGTVRLHPPATPSARREPPCPT